MELNISTGNLAAWAKSIVNGANRLIYKERKYVELLTKIG